MAFPSPSVWLPYLINAVQSYASYWSGKSHEEKTEMLLVAAHEQAIATYGDWSVMSGGVAAALSHPAIGLDAIHEKLDSIVAATVGVASPLELTEAKVGGLYSDMPTVLTLLNSIFARVAPGEDPPPISTSNDSARILAALYYIAQAVIVPAWAVDNAEVLAAITAAKESIKGPSDTNVGAVYTALFEPTWGVVRSVNDNTNAVETSINNNVDAAETAILDALANFQPGGGTPSGYPGLSSVTLSTSQPFAGPFSYPGAMDGCLVEFTSMPAGTGHHDIGSFTNWQHAGWICFLDDQGYADEVQWLGPEKANYCPKRLASASGVLVFPRTLGQGILTPWVRNV